MTISIIIAVKTWQKNLEECVAKCLELDYHDFEIVILPDSFIDNDFLKRTKIPVKVVPTGVVGPGEKRDRAINEASGEIFAFLDDDAYPAKDWLRKAVRNFEDPLVAAVGGPAITPKNDSFRQKASGAIFESFLVSAGFVYRYLPGKKQEIEDYPSCNLFVRKSVMQELGGFNTNFWPGEDTKLCLDIVKKLKKKIIYDPEVVVWHHRRRWFVPHIKQVSNYALHRGYFVKKYPETSFKPAYFIPSLFVLLLFVGGLISLLSKEFRILYLAAFFLYLFLVFIFSFSKDLRLLPAVFFGIISTHVAYGVYFLKGLISIKLKEEKV
ncbi:MAG: glycosyltransferase [Candidatus Omnitrophica bacterium]|nr:glycosyltransferase [Candidatus Omnitrophota bacterium]